MPSALSGLSEGLWSSIDQQREENRRLEDERSQMERGVLNSLLQADDPRVRSLAVSGLLDAAGPKRRMKGMSGLLGEFQQNPAIQDIHRYLSTPQTTVTPGLPSTNLMPTGPTTPGPVVPQPSQGPQLPAPPKQGAAALPTTSPVTGGPMVGTPPPQPGVIKQQHAGPPVGRTDVTYPQAFVSPEERYAQQARGKAQGDVEGDVAGYMATGLSRADAIAQVRAERIRKGSGAGAFQGVTEGSMLPEGTLDAFGRPVDPKQQYRAVNGQYHPVVASAAQNPIRVAAMPNGKPGLYRINHDNTRELIAAVPEGTKYVRMANADGSEQLIEVPGFTAPEGTAGATPVAQGTTASTVGSAPPAPGEAPMGVAAASGPPPAPAPAGPKVIAQTKPASFTPVTVKKADGTIGGALKTKDGQFVDSATKQPLAGAVEVPSSANLDKPLSIQAKKDLETIGTTQAMIQRVEAALGNRGTDPNEGYVHQGWEVIKAQGQQALYNVGLSPSDPAYDELIPLAANLRVLATSPYLRGIRNMKYIEQIQQHIPSATDSPLLIRQKLEQMKQTFTDMVKEIHDVEGTGLNPKTGDGKKPTDMMTVLNWARDQRTAGKTVSDQDAINHWEGNGWTITDKH